MLLDLRSLLEAAADEHTGTHTGTGAVATASASGALAFAGSGANAGQPGTSEGAGEATPGVTVFPGLAGGAFRPREEISGDGIATAAPATAEATGSLVFAAGGFQRAAAAEAESQSTQALSGASTARGYTGTADAAAGLGFRARRISSADGRPAAASGLAQVRIVGMAAIEAPPAVAGGAGTQRANGLTTAAAPVSRTAAHAGVRANGLQRASALPADGRAAARIRYPRRLGTAGAISPATRSLAAGTAIQVVTGKATARAEPAGAVSAARRRFRPDPVALWTLGITDDDLRMAS